MNIKMLKAAVAGLILSVSGFVNAGLIEHTYDIEYDGAILTSNYTGDGNFEIGSSLELDFNADINDYWQGMETKFWPPIYVSNSGTRTGDYSWSYLLDGIEVNFGSILSKDSSSVHIFQAVDFYSGMFDQLKLTYTLTASTTGNVNLISSDLTFFASLWTPLPFEAEYVQVPEPSTLAIFALGIMGLASRRFKKQ